jgi:starvation-inducible DNA-binding protein
MQALSLDDRDDTLPAVVRARVAASLNERLADGVDLWTQVKVGAWNLESPCSTAVRSLLENLAADLAAFDDALALRAVRLGAHACATARFAASRSRIEEYSFDGIDDGLVPARLVLDRLDTYLAGLRRSAGTAEDVGDDETLELIAGGVARFTRHAQLLRRDLASPCSRKAAAS